MLSISTIESRGKDKDKKRGIKKGSYRKIFSLI